MKNIFDSEYNVKGYVGSVISISGFQQLLALNLSDFQTLLVNFDGNMIISPYFNEAQFSKTLI